MIQRKLRGIIKTAAGHFLAEIETKKDSHAVLFETEQASFFCVLRTKIKGELYLWIFYPAS